MPTPAKSTHRCISCGQEYPAETLVCPKCKVILLTRNARRRPTPPWVIVLLVVAILILLTYAITLIRQLVSMHRFDLPSF